MREGRKTRREEGIEEGRRDEGRRMENREGKVRRKIR